MPVCASESLGKLWRRRESGSGGCSPPSPSSPVSCSPPLAPRTAGKGGQSRMGTPPPLIRSSSSTWTLLDRRYLAPSRPPSPPPFSSSPPHGLLDRLLGWYPSFILRALTSLLGTLFFLGWSQLLLAGPALWLSAWLWLIWKVVQLPVDLAKSVLALATTPAEERSRRKRTVLITGGSTVQSLHLARNFHSAGLRVVAVDVEGLFGLARFSTAVDKFHTVPRPRGESGGGYVEALVRVATSEGASYFVPSSATTPAYYDALVKPHLELHGIACFCPGLKEVLLLDDPAEFLRRCNSEGLPTPAHYPVMSAAEVARLYDDGTLAQGEKARYVMINTGPAGCMDPMKVLLPPVKRELKPPHLVSPQTPWVVLRDDPSGAHFVTCTTVKESRVVANVTCRVEGWGRGRLVPVDHPGIESWLAELLPGRLPTLRPLSGHLSFRFVESSGALLPLGCKVGVPLAYILHTAVQPRLLWPPCRHFDRRLSGPLVSPGRYWIHAALLDALRRPTPASLSRFLGTVLDKREALFAPWDPLPYFAFYHFQLPLDRVLRFLRGHRPSFHSTLLVNH